MNIPPPSTKNELFSRMLDVLRHGEYEMPNEPRYRGTGAPGNFLEDILGLTTGNKDIPDSVGWEIKYYTKKTNLITLFHKEPEPKGVMRYMVKEYGWKDKNGRLSFRHTIAGKSDRFRVDRKEGQIVIRPIKRKGTTPFWTDDAILNSAGAKLRRLLLVEGQRSVQKVSYYKAYLYETIQLSSFIFEVLRGTVKIDFDAREMKPGSKGLRNHGTKFRVSPDDICRLYAKKERLG